MQMNTLVLCGMVMVVLMVSFCDGTKYLRQQNNNDDSDSQSNEAAARAIFDAESNDDDDSFEKRANANPDCVMCKFNLIPCCKPNICVKKFLRPDKCLRIDAGK